MYRVFLKRYAGLDTLLPYELLLSLLMSYYVAISLNTRSFQTFYMHLCIVYVEHQYPIKQSLTIIGTQDQPTFITLRVYDTNWFDLMCTSN